MYNSLFVLIALFSIFGETKGMLRCDISFPGSLIPCILRFVYVDSISGKEQKGEVILFLVET
jgi:hypothetical protein